MPARRAPTLGPDGLPVDGKEKETFGCPFPGCGQAYSRMEYLKRHQRKHQDVRPFLCKDCSKAFARSDVLLRHRRRCHPTPPPADRSSQSPMPPARPHPSVPISSSRTSDRDTSPHARAGRKHPRASSPSAQGGDSQRRRMSDNDGDNDGEEDEDDDDDRFTRNGMGNGGVFSYGSSYYPADSESSSYTPHLLPMFQVGSNGQFHNVNDPNHLEDASVLLSMAYPSGVPSTHRSSNGTSESVNTAATAAAVAAAADWESSQNSIGMMMASAAAAASLSNPATGSTDPKNASAGTSSSSSGPSTSFSSGAAENQARQAAPDASLPEPEGGLWASMNWLNPTKDGDAWAVAPSPRPLSPFNLANIFSPGTLNNLASLPLIEGGDGEFTGKDTDPLTQANQVVTTILDQLEKYEVPQTNANPNPERPLLRLENINMWEKAGRELSKTSRFYLPSERFAGCYQIPHWNLPPLRTMSLMASRAFHTILDHFSFVHGPTFRLIDTAACLAFAICTVGGIRAGRRKGDLPPGCGDSIAAPAISVLPEGTTWRTMASVDWNADGVDGLDFEEDARRLEEWEGASVVRHEKTNMLVKSFSLASGVLMTEYNVALLQGLILYHAPYFLSEDEHERGHANMFLGTIVNITRQIGFFTQELEHFETNIETPRSPYTAADLDRCWKRWIHLESRRRTAYLVYHLDTMSSLESSIPCIISPCELSYIPLPAPDSLWKAETAEEWLAAVKSYRPMNLDEAMRRIFYLPSFGAFDELHEKSDSRYYNLLNENDYGAFARVAMVITLLRGVIDIGQGKRDRGDWRDLTDLWISCSWLKPGDKCLGADGNDLGQINRQSLRDRFTLGLERWRQGWDFDSLCMSPSSSSLSPVSNVLASASVSPISPSDRPTPTQKNIKDRSRKVYCEEALPFYWLAQALLNMIKATPADEATASRNVFEKLDFGSMLGSARAFTRMGEGAVPSAMTDCSLPTDTAFTTPQAFDMQAFGAQAMF